MKAKNEFWQHVDELRKGITLETLCKETNLGIGTILVTRSKGKLPNLTDADKIAVHLNTTVDYLLHGKESTTYTSSERELLDNYRRAPTYIKLLIEQVLKNQENDKNF